MGGLVGADDHRREAGTDGGQTQHRDLFLDLGAQDLGKLVAVDDACHAAPLLGFGRVYPPGAAPC